MAKAYNIHNYFIPLIIYVVVITLILVMKLLVPWTYVISISAVLMLSVPFILKSDLSDLRWDRRGVLIGIAASIAVLLIYISLLAGYGLYSGKSLMFQRLSYTFILAQLLLVALPEEVFFRGFLQQRLGNTLWGIVAVSLLFAFGHFVTLCLGGGHDLSVCSQAVLTFFPSLVMGYLYMATGKLWASVIFHFLANLVHISAGFS